MAMYKTRPKRQEPVQPLAAKDKYEAWLEQIDRYLAISVPTQVFSVEDRIALAEQRLLELKTLREMDIV